MKAIPFLLFLLLATSGYAQIWTTNANGNWNSASNWSTGSVPNSAGASATFGNAITANRTVTITSPVTAGTLNFSGTKNYTIAGSGLTLDSSSGNALINVSGTGSHTISAPITLNDALTLTQNGSGLTLSGGLNTNWKNFTVDGTGPTTISGAISSGGHLTKQGTGTLNLSGNNSGWAGNFQVQNGTLSISNANALGSANWGNSVASGGSLQLKNGINVTEGNVEIAGVGNTGSVGAINNNSGNNTLNTTISLTDDAKIYNQGGQLTTQGQIALNGHDLSVANNGAKTTLIDSQIQGSGTVNFTAGTTTLGGSQSNTYGGLTTVNSGTLNLAKTGGATAITGDLNIANGATVKLQGDNQISDYQTTTINSTGTLNFNGKTDTLKSIELNGGGTVDLNGGTAILNNSSGKVSYVAGSQTGKITDGNLQIQGYSYEFEVANGTKAVDLQVDAAMSGSAILKKTGAGTMEIAGTGNNTFNGASVDAGTLQLNKSSGNAIGAGTITVNNGGTLLLGASNQIGDTVNMVLNGGTFDTGAAGAVETLGVLTLSANSIIDLSANTVLHFANSSSAWWNGVLTLTGWNNTSSIFFGNNASGLTSTQLSNISFAGFGQGALILSDGRITPLAAVPEAKVILGVALLVLAILFGERKAIMGFLVRRLPRSQAFFGSGKSLSN